MSSSVLIIAHGSRRPEANADLVTLAGMLRQQMPEAHVEHAYLELAEPDIPTGLKNCVKAGATEIRMLPYFLSAGSHVTEDLSRYQAEFLVQHPGVSCLLCPPIGLHPLLMDILRDRLQQTLDAAVPTH